MRTNGPGTEDEPSLKPPRRGLSDHWGPIWRAARAAGTVSAGPPSNLSMRALTTCQGRTGPLHRHPLLPPVPASDIKQAFHQPGLFIRFWAQAPGPTTHPPVTGEPACCAGRLSTFRAGMLLPAWSCKGAMSPLWLHGEMQGSFSSLFPKSPFLDTRTGSRREVSQDRCRQTTGADEQEKGQLKAISLKCIPPLGWAEGSFRPSAWTDGTGKGGSAVTPG